MAATVPLVPPVPPRSVAEVYGRLAQRASKTGDVEMNRIFQRTASGWAMTDQLRARAAEQRGELLKLEKQEDMHMFELRKAQFKLAQAERRYEVASADVAELDATVSALEAGQDVPTEAWRIAKPSYLTDSMS